MEDDFEAQGDFCGDGFERTCPACLSTKVEYCQRTGNYICTICGVTTNEDVITNEVEFYADGAKTKASAQFLKFKTGKTERGSIGSLKKGTIVYDPQEEINIAEDYNNRVLGIMEIIANKPSINIPDAIKPALFYYKIAHKANLYRHKCLSHVCSVCIYIVCRLRKTGHLLIDFAEVIEADVFLLGSIYLSITRFAHIEIPLIDPTLLIERYGVKSGLGPKYRDICHTAARIIGRMSRDYIVTGRRPNGLCGAAILVSARLHGVPLSIKKMVQVVKISMAVLKQRLNDLGSTKSAALTLEDFFSNKLEKIIESDPPSYQRSRSNYKKRVLLEEQNEWLSPEIIEQVMRANQDIELFRKLQETYKMGIDLYEETQTLFCTPKRKRGRPRKNPPESQEPAKSSEMSLIIPEDLNLPLIQPLDESVPVIEGFEDDDEVLNCILSPEEIALKTQAFDEENREFYQIKKEKQNRKELEEELSFKRIAKGPRLRKAGLSQLATEHLLKSVMNPGPKRTISEIMSNLKEAGDTLETTEDFLSMCFDHKKRKKLINMKVPDHIQKKYDEKNKKSQESLENLQNSQSKTSENEVTFENSALITDSIDSITPDEQTKNKRKRGTSSKQNTTKKNEKMTIGLKNNKETIEINDEDFPIIEPISIEIEEDEPVNNLNNPPLIDLIPEENIDNNDSDENLTPEPITYLEASPNMNDSEELSISEIQSNPENDNSPIMPIEANIFGNQEDLILEQTYFDSNDEAYSEDHDQEMYY